MLHVESSDTSDTAGEEKADAVKVDAVISKLPKPASEVGESSATAQGMF